MYENISKNRIKTALIIAGFVFVISLLGYLIGFYLDHFYGEGGIFPVILMGLALIMAIIASFGSYYFSDRAVIKMTGAKPLTRGQNPGVFYMVEGLSIAAGIPVPKIYIIEEPGLNAFATGRNPDNGVVVLTRGLIDRLSNEELKGVISHELSHIKNYDILLGTIIVVLVGMVSIAGNVMMRFMFFGGSGFRARRSSRSQGSGGGIIMIVFFIIGIIFIML
ncbi:MAG: M48 family metalloprotease, partial [Actinobacteria bacterium]|nr:M48 family metalloprotease [Actinomycetota bacterium]